MPKGVKGFQSGISGNPKGRKPLPADLRKANHLNKIEAAKVINDILYKTSNDIEAIISDPNTNALQKMLCQIVKIAMEKGDHFRLNFIFDRCIGKVVEQVEVKLPKPTVIKLIDQDAVEVIGSFKEDDE